MGEPRDHVTLELDGRDVRFSNPDKPFFPDAGITKLALCEYYLAVADAALARLERVGDPSAGLDERRLAGRSCST